eukprot:Rhum_TRINITY_DN1797_c0_g1::Rhum_TRINITY_DN1797_c0_g1_i1::g.4918::m.4918
MHQTSALHNELTGADNVKLHGKVPDRLFNKTLTDLRTAELRTVGSGNGRGVGVDVDHEGGRVKGKVRDGSRLALEAERVAHLDVQLVNVVAGQHHDVAQTRLIRGNPLQSLEVAEGLDLQAEELVAGVAVGHKHLVLHGKAAAEDAKGEELLALAAHLDGRDGGLEVVCHALLRHGDVLDDGVEQRLQRAGADGGVRAHVPHLAAAVQNGVVKLVVVGGKLKEEHLNLVQRVLDLVLRRAVHLVQHHDRLQVRLQRLLQHVARARLRALVRVHEKDEALKHRQRTLHLSGEVAMARRVHDVDRVLRQLDARVLRKNGNAALLLEVVAVHDTRRRGVLLHGAGLRQKRVDERRLAVVDVRNHADVPQLRVRARGAAVPALRKGGRRDGGQGGGGRDGLCHTDDGRRRRRAPHGSLLERSAPTGAQVCCPPHR